MSKRPRGGSRSASAGGRRTATRVKTAKGRKTSSTRWLKRQLNDPYVAEAQRRGYRSRAAFKLIELDERFHLLGRAKSVVDLGAAPGGWTQVAVERGGRVVAVDRQPMAPVSGAQVIEVDVLDEAAPGRIRMALEGAADVVLCDMAPASTGHAGTDHLRIMALAEAALALAVAVLSPGGAFVCKILQGGGEKSLLAEMKQHFRSVRHAKPPASRAESAELYVVATGFRGGASNER